jgi:single-strand DNA-binding protein
MKTQNFVQLIGYLGDNPVMKTAANGSRLARFRVATDYFRRAQDGTIVKKTTWHHVLAWDFLAEKVPDNFIKGTHILVQGELRNRTFKNKDGVLTHITEIHASQLLNLDR